MQHKVLKANLLLLFAAWVWGFAFVAQKIGSEYVGAFTFNGIRFALGSLTLVPVFMYFNNKNRNTAEYAKLESPIKGGIAAGLIIFIANTFQQLGMSFTSVGNAAFITAMYIVLVPVLATILKHKISLSNWAGVAFAVIGLYFITVKGGFTAMNYGDILQIFCAVFFAAHIVLIDHLVKKVDGIQLSLVQFVTCSALSLICAVIFEDITLGGIMQGALPILYGGVCSVGIAYTLQVIGQKNAKASHAALILSLEAVFGAFGGLIILHENLGFRGYVGCALMLAGILISQYPNIKKLKAAA
ncbi:MAG: transporter protein [Firmicutes bacterium]|nr:transporter protein [Bacillota bacterium]